METYNVKIKGTTPLLQHRFCEETAVGGKKGTRAVHVVQREPRDEAERFAYRRKDGTLYLPGAAIARLLREAGGSHKQKGTRRSIKYIVPAAVRVGQDDLDLYNGAAKKKKKATDFEVDSRPVTIPATKGRIMRHRPRLDEWSAEFTLVVNDDVLDPDLIHQLLVEGGQRIGVGDYRPEKGGPFGTFQVELWKKL